MNESDLSDAALAELLTLSVEVCEFGSTVYRNHLGQVHRVHGPTIIWNCGERHWLQNDLMHRTDGPAAEFASGGKCWYLYDQILSEEEFNERIKSV